MVILTFYFSADCNIMSLTIAENLSKTFDTNLLAVTCSHPLFTVEATNDLSLTMTSLLETSSMCSGGSYGEVSQLARFTAVSSSHACQLTLSISDGRLLATRAIISI